MESLDYTCRERAHMLAYSQNRRRGRIETEWFAGQFSGTAAAHAPARTEQAR